MDPKGANRGPDRLIARLAARQHAVVAIDEHRDRAAFEADRARDAQLALMQYRLVRFTWRRVRDEPARVAATVRVLLRQ